MKHEELGLFTHEELSLFRHCDMELPPIEIIEIIRNDNTPIPLQTVEKLQKLSDELNQKGAEIKMPKAPLTAAVAFSGLSFMVNYLDKLPDIAQKYTPIVQSVVKEIISFVQALL